MSETRWVCFAVDFTAKNNATCERFKIAGHEAHQRCGVRWVVSADALVTERNENGGLKPLWTEDGFRPPALVNRIMEAIRQYPNLDAEHNLAPIVVLAIVEDELSRAGEGTV